MALPVKLRDVIDAIEMANDGMTSYINRKTGDVVSLTLDDISYAEQDDSSDFIPEWQQESIAEAKTVLADEAYITLPDQHDIHEYSIMERFCWSIKDEDVQDRLLRAIKTKGAFRRFKDRIVKEGVRQDWFAFRDQAFRRIAVDFLESEKIAFKDE